MNSVTNSESLWSDHYKQAKAWQTYPDENLVRLIRKLQPNKESALDFGCGSGRHTALLLNEGFATVMACDRSKEANRVSQLYGVDFKTIVNNSALPYNDHQFSVVVAWGVLHYNESEDQKNLMNEFKRIMKPDGWLMGTVRSSNDTHLQHVSEMKNHTICFFTEQELHELLTPFSSRLHIGYMERTELDNLKARIAHWFFALQPVK